MPGGKHPPPGRGTPPDPRKPAVRRAAAASPAPKRLPSPNARTARLPLTTAVPLSCPAARSTLNRSQLDELKRVKISILQHKPQSHRYAFQSTEVGSARPANDPFQVIPQQLDAVIEAESRNRRVHLVP